MMRKTILVILCFIVLLFSGCAEMVKEQGMPNPTSAQKLNQNLNAFDYDQAEFYLGAGDEIEIKVWRNEEFNQKIRINPSGKCFYPTIGSIQVAGTTIEGLRDTIVKGLSDQIVDPQVSIEVVSLRSRKVFVLGEVKRPGVFRMDGPMHIVEALSAAAGVTVDAETENILVIRGGFKNSDARIINLDTLLDGEDLDQPVSLAKGDIVFVPRSTIADVELFCKRLSNILGPFLDLERVIIMGDMVDDILRGDDATRGTINLNIVN